MQGASQNSDDSQMEPDPRDWMGPDYLDGSYPYMLTHEQLYGIMPETDDTPDDEDDDFFDDEDDAPPDFDPAAFQPVELIVTDGSSELDDVIDKAIGIIHGLRTALLFPGDAVTRAAIKAADDWLSQFQSPMGC